MSIRPLHDRVIIKRKEVESKSAGGIVLTGGTSKMEGAVELAEEIFHLPVRLGMPSETGGLQDIVHNPIHATGVGLLHYGLKQQFSPLPGSTSTVTSSEGDLSKMKRWIQNNF